MEFTKEKLTEIIAAANEVITALADENEDLSKSNTIGMIRAYDYLNDEAAPPEVVKRLAEIALAAIQQEPVLSVIFKDGWPESSSAAITTTAPKFADGVYEFYAAPPAPIVPDERQSLNNGIVGFDEGWNACRAAMLQAGNSPVVTDAWISCSEKLPDAHQQVLVYDLNGEGELIAWRAEWQSTSGPTGKWQWVFQIQGIEHEDVRIERWLPYPSPVEEIK